MTNISATHDPARACVRLRVAGVTWCKLDPAATVHLAEVLADAALDAATADDGRQLDVDTIDTWAGDLRVEILGGSVRLTHDGDSVTLHAVDADRLADQVRELGAAVG
ncbi:hypothetical protein [Tsukamurella strandjordii]|uniref:Uncharacterized protein n=1 Tax=Tsukamurella strandjordii TaxID=147577 RepID=A0AA90NJ24_9ACTN|nr:hypothetical protein [Tsukamurella strandjordii]MDP0398924.1 hypothetical protein [Tsukamurella strandjordii]